MRWVIFCLFLAGCARFPKEDCTSTRNEPPSLEETVANAREQGPFAVGDFPDSYWWQLFEDDQLSWLIEQALANQPSLKAAEARVRTAEEEAAIQRASLYPMIGLYAQAAQQYFGKNNFFRAFAPTFPGRINEYELELTFSYEFDFWGKNRNLLHAALGEARAQAAEAAQVQVSLSTSVALTYFKWQIEKRRYALLQEKERLAKESLKLTTMRKQDALDDEQQRLVTESAQLFVMKQRVQSYQILRIWENQLKMLLGMGPDDALELELHALPEDTRIALPADLSSNLLARRPDLTALIWRVEAAAERIGAARADFYPSINLSALVGYDSVFFRKLFSWGGSKTAIATPALNLPIFTGGRLRAQLKARQAEFDKATYDYNEQLLQAVKEVADQIAIVQMTAERLGQQHQIVQETTKINDLVYQSSQVGIKSTLDHIDYQQVLLNEQETALYDILDRLVATVGLIKALGGGFSCQ